MLVGGQAVRASSDLRPLISKIEALSESALTAIGLCKKDWDTALRKINASHQKILEKEGELDTQTFWRHLFIAGTVLTAVAITACVADMIVDGLSGLLALTILLAFGCALCVFGCTESEKKQKDAKYSLKSHFTLTVPHETSESYSLSRPQ